MLGGTGLTDSDGREVDALLKRPKRVALLAYLASPKPGTWHRRDSVLATFWEEHDQSKARSALRSALYTLRGHLPDGAIKSRGDDEIGLDADFFTTDVAAMADDVASGRFENALDRYQGELLPGLFVPEADGFEKWLSRERTRVRDIARHAAEALAAEREAAGDLRGATDAARRNSLLDPDDEGAARRLIALLDRAGDRSQAFAVYDQFRTHLYETFGVRPSAETVALLDAIRTRHVPATVAASAASEAHQVPVATPASPIPAAAVVTPQVENGPRARQKQYRWIPAAVVIAAVAWMGFRTMTGGPASDSQTPATDSGRSLVVLPMVNETGDTTMAYVATGIAEGIARRLDGIGGYKVRSFARAEWSVSSLDTSVLAQQVGSVLLLASRLRRVGDSLEVSSSVRAGPPSDERRISARRFTMAGLRDAEAIIAADVIGSVFRAPIPTDPRNSAHRVDPESYRLTLEGWHQLFLRRAGQQVGEARQKAATLFSQAIDLDPLNARAWSGLSSVWASLVVIDGVSFDEGFPRAVAASERALALDSLEGTALANLAIMQAYQANDLSVATDFVRKAEAAEPSNPEVFLIKALILRSAHRFDDSRDVSRIAVQLDPLSSFYSNFAGEVEFCAGRPLAALTAFEATLSISPSNHIAHAAVVRALVLLGRYEEAISSWRSLATLTADTALASRLATAKGRDDYWSIRHAEGRSRLAALDRQVGRKRPLSLVQASFQAGDEERGYREIAKAEQLGTRGLYRLPCMPEIDEFRDTPRFKSTAARLRLGARDKRP